MIFFPQLENCARDRSCHRCLIPISRRSLSSVQTLCPRSSTTYDNIHLTSHDKASGWMRDRESKGCEKRGSMSRSCSVTSISSMPTVVTHILILPSPRGSQIDPNRFICPSSSSSHFAHPGMLSRGSAVAKSNESTALSG